MKWIFLGVKAISICGHVSSVFNGASGTLSELISIKICNDYDR